MPVVEISLPTRVDNEIDRLVEQDAFMNREQAVEELLSKGIAAYGPSKEPDDVAPEEVFTQAIDDQQDPAMDGE